MTQRCTETGLAEIVCAVEPTGTYHEALAQFLEAHGVDVVLVSNHVAALNRRTLDGTWGKSDPKDAHNLCDLLERGHVLFYSRPDAPIPALRRLVRLLRQARTDRAASKVRFRNTLLPALGPAGEPLPSALVAALPGLLQRLCPASPAAPGRGRGRPRGERATREEAVPSPALPPALAFELTDLAAGLIAVQARVATIEAELVRVARPLPAYPWLRSIPRGGPDGGGDPPRGARGHRLVHALQPTPEARGAGYHLGGDGPVDRDGADLQVRPPAPPVGALSSRAGGRAHGAVADAAGGDAREAAGRSLRLPEGEYRAGGEAPPHCLGGLAEWAALRAGVGQRARGPAGDRPSRGARRPPRGPTTRSGATADRRP
ncbi:MAG: transposase [Candidatus Methylomirabilota bacterium]